MTARVLFGHVTFLMPIKCPSGNEELTGRYVILELWGDSKMAVYI